MIEARPLALTLTIMLAVTVRRSPAAAANDSPRFSSVQAPSELLSKLRTLIDKLRAVDMPAGIVKTNGRIEATQVDIAAKYPGWLESVMVEEGDEVGAGQTIAVISSPEYEAQLSGARAQALKAKQALARCSVRRLGLPAEKNRTRNNHSGSCARIASRPLTMECLEPPVQGRLPAKAINPRRRTRLRLAITLPLRQICAGWPGPVQAHCGPSGSA